ncbi:MAG: DsbA family protein [Bacillota bacterium]|jgi:protein-disulfide isomerase|uniref:DsbA family protein n=1 Tax=Fictibacillus TaxID=1329200 RepID=UPI0018CE796C|nr:MULTISPECIES: DsbA family protein [unclassified Fictibacillus]MBH0157170.1 DsbA family protein [Fictibacillus sp. 5RED26]MBH0159491.1 DsbA family protein [Fictibacillus sp. 26RED30]MBH0163710.1 DsbA family protein [Fictibacillus sp. 7GRE50]MBH0169664.1 DsbA family protein [Fictibacillus sp. 18YEL24]MBH0174164.1 DsbA family protein [Fictibacillus sp. 23RED33]
MKQKSNPFKKIVLGTLVLFGIILGLFLISNANQDSDLNTQSSYKSSPSIKGQPTIGDAKADVQVVEFGDYKCPACKAWSAQIFPKLQKDFIDTGKVKFSFINVLFHGEESELASIAGESVFAQDEEAFWIFNKKMFEEQPAENHDGAWITTDKILEVLSKNTPEIDREKVKQDMESKATLEEVSKDIELVKEYKVEQTPSIMVNGTMLTDPFNYEELTKLIEQELEGK